MYKQLIIVRRDLNMSPGKLAAQVSHASMAFLTALVKENTPHVLHLNEGVNCYQTSFFIEQGLYDEWFNDAFTKVVCGARDRSRLMRAVEKAKELGMMEGKDFFIIRDACRTELEPEDEDGTTPTCIGFAPMEAEIIDQIGREYHLYG